MQLYHIAHYAKSKKLLFTNLMREMSNTYALIIKTLAQKKAALRGCSVAL